MKSLYNEDLQKKKSTFITNDIKKGPFNLKTFIAHY